MIIDPRHVIYTILAADPYAIYNGELKTRHYILHTQWMQILYSSYESPIIIVSSFTKIVSKIKVNLAENIQVKTYAQQEGFVSKIQPLSLT